MTRAWRASLFLGDVRRDAELFARKSDVENANFVAQRVPVNAERARGAPQISGAALDGTDDVFLFEFLLGEVERDPVGQKLVDHFLELPIEIHDAPPRIRMRSAR